MNEELGQLDADLKGLFIENKFDEMTEMLQEQPDSVIKELSESAWNIIKKYYDTERFDLLFQHMKFVAYSCYLVEYAYKLTIISKEAYDIMMMVYNDIYEIIKQQG